MLELSSRGDSSNVDMLVGDIYGRDYETMGLSATTIASSFGKVVSGNKQLSDYNPAGVQPRRSVRQPPQHTFRPAQVLAIATCVCRENDGLEEHMYMQVVFCLWRYLL